MSEELSDRWYSLPNPPELIEGERCTYVERVGDCGDRPFIPGFSSREVAEALTGVIRRLAESDRPPSQLHTTSRCTSCKYYNGHSGVVCAVHPFGWQSEGDCSDWSDRP